MRLVFAGTPVAALPSLTQLLDSPHEVLAVLTRPVAPTGRGRRMERSPVHTLAAERGVEVLTPGRVSDAAFLARLRELAPDCCPVVAYGALIRPAALAIPVHGWVNLHFSLLPAWRGAAPVHHAVMAGDDVTGATTFALDAGMDTGPIYGTTTEPIGPRDTAGDVLDRLAESGAVLLAATLDGIESGALRARPQPADGVSFAPKLEAADGHVDWTAPALAVDRRVRGVTPVPGAWSMLGAQRLRLGVVSICPAAAARLEPGTIQADRGEVRVGTSTQPVTLSTVQTPGKRAVPAGDWVRGARLDADARLS